MPSPSIQIKLSELYGSFAAHIAVASAGRAFEVKEGKTVIGIVAKNSDNATSEHTFTEAKAALNPRAIFDLVRAGHTVVITRLGNQSSLIVTAPVKEGPK